MSLRGPIVLALACLYTLLHSSEGMDLAAYKQLMDMAMKPRVEGENQDDIKKAVTELVILHYHLAVGQSYTIGSSTGLFGKRKRRFASFGGGWGYNSGWGSSGGYDRGGYRNDPWYSDPWRNDYGGGYGGNNYNNHPGNNYNNHPGNNYNDHPGNNYNSYGSGGNFKTFTNSKKSDAQIINCPVQSNQSAVYQLNATGNGYPMLDIGTELFFRSQLGSDLFFFCLVARTVTPGRPPVVEVDQKTAIGNELFFRSLLGSDLFFFCLIRRTILPGASPVVEVDQNFVTANMTCPTQDLTLFSYTYQNTLIGGRCWIVQGFQELVRFSICQTRACVNCKLQGHEKSSGYQDWNNNNYHPNDYNNQYNHGNNVTVNQCFTEYRTVQVVSYCENLPQNARIVYDRIIIPLYCTCKSIDCMKRLQRHW